MRSLEFMLDKVDRSRMLREDGSRMNDAEVFDFLNASSRHSPPKV
jgi:hypothetical protein